jgi:hypothetical protein
MKRRKLVREDTNQGRGVKFNKGLQILYHLSFDMPYGTCRIAIILYQVVP